MRRSAYGRYELVRNFGFAAALAGFVSSELWPQQYLIQGMILLPGTVFMGAASVLHWRLPKEKKEPVELSWRGMPIHTYLLFLVTLAHEATCFTEVFRTAENSGRWKAAENVWIVLLLLGEGLGYVQYFRQKWARKNAHASKKRKAKKRKEREDPWD